jgi:2,3-bisphosphoglycerate-independent phosphoglycerate mutase
MDRLAGEGTLGLVKTVPDGYPPGSDVANLSILGYDPAEYYTGRSPLEAASIGVTLGEDDLSLRCNLVNIAEEDGTAVMGDYSAGHVSTDEARELILTLDRELSGEGIRFYPGVSYRHLLVWTGGPDGLETTPPHDISGRAIEGHLPKGEGAERLLELMAKAREILRDHPVNRKRIQDGKVPANAIWLWGQGRKPAMPTISERFGVEGAIISAVDLMKGLGIYAGLKVVEVPGATGYLDTNYKGKVEYGLRELKERDLLCIHVEAPDEAGHQGKVEDKVLAIEDFDGKVVGRVMDALQGSNDYRVLILCDHPTPVKLKTHVSEPVPFIIYPALDASSGKGYGYNEEDAHTTGLFVEEGHRLISMLMEGD